MATYITFGSDIQEEIPVKIIKLFSDYRGLLDDLFIEKEEADRGIRKALKTMKDLGFEGEEIKVAKERVQKRFNRNLRYKLFSMKEEIDKIMREIPKEDYDPV